MVNIISGGLHGDTGLAFQDFLVVPVGAETFREAIEWVARSARRPGPVARAWIVHPEGGRGGFRAPLSRRPEAALDLLVEAVARSGRSLDDEVAFAVDVAATHFFDGTVYRLEDTPEGIDADGLIGRLEQMTLDYPIVSIEDGLAEDDWEGWARLTERLGDRVQILGDDLFATNAARLRRGIDTGVANSVLVKMNQIGTLTETLAVVRLSQAARYAAGGLGTLGRDRGRLPRRPCRRHLRGPDQDRLSGSVRAPRQVQPTAPYRGAARRGCNVRRPRGDRHPPLTANISKRLTSQVLRLFA